mmetsp:Transcript_8148/g.16051  ORF Transcript_8148/g.16051 Transcript_8148/m.16051 type:complete len:198 (+) Transcript_8148:3907-4500(+)
MIKLIQSHSISSRAVSQSFHRRVRNIRAKRDYERALTMQTDLKHALKKLDGNVAALKTKFKHSNVVLRTFDLILKDVNCTGTESPSPKSAYEREVILAVKKHKRKKYKQAIPTRPQRFVQEKVDGGILEYPEKLPSVKPSKSSPAPFLKSLHSGVESRYLTTESGLMEYREDYENEISRAGIGYFLARKAQARLKDR